MKPTRAQGAQIVARCGGLCACKYQNMTEILWEILYLRVGLVTVFRLQARQLMRWYSR